MNVRKVLAGSVLAAALSTAGLIGAATASADSSEGNGGAATSTNPTDNDAMGFGVVNHMKGNDVNTDGWNSGYNGVGHLRSDQEQPDPNTFAGTNRVRVVVPATVDLQNPDMTKGNKVTPKK